MNRTLPPESPRRLLHLALLPATLWLATSCGDDVTNVFTPDPVVDASTASEEVLAGLDVESEITSVSIASPPVVRFTLMTADGTPIVGLVPLWEDSNRFVRFTIVKLVPGQGGDPDSWVSYVRDAGEPDYDTGSSLVDNGNGNYTFTFNTDVANVPGVPYEPARTHRVAGQIGSRSVALEAQNLWLDFVPAGGALPLQRDIAVMDSCNECHVDLVFHGRRFQVEYCVTCHNPDLAMGEGNFSFMIHRIHSAGTFAVLDGGVDFSEVTYPQDQANCRKCHNEADAATPQASNWMTLPNIEACDGCHNVFATDTHSGPMQNDNQACTLCHGVGEEFEIELVHRTTNATPNNPDLLPGQRNITYELMSASVGGGNEVTIDFRILSDGNPLDLTNLPMDLVDPMTMLGFRYPTFLLAWAMPQDGIAEPADFNNMGQRGAQPLSLDLDEFDPIETMAPIGTLTYDGMTGVMTATIMDAASQFPMGATMRTVGLQNYLQQDLDGDGEDDASLHTLSVMLAVTGDSSRREVVDSANCSNCHEWFEGHGGNRVLGFGSQVICTMCHNPNQSSSGRTVTDPTARGLDADLAAAIMDGTLDPSVDPNDPLTYPEDAQNFKDMVHGIHSSGFRTRAFQHIRGPGRQGYYDWSEVTFPRGASTNQCTLCHMDDTYELPLDADVLATTVRTTGVNDGMDMDAEMAFQNVPNDSDWVNSAESSACFYCHTSTVAWAHIAANGGLVSEPRVGGAVGNRMNLGSTADSCSVCHGPGRIADLEVVHEF